LSQSVQNFHNLIVHHAGNQTLAVQAGILAEVVALHMTVAARHLLVTPEGRAHFQTAVRSCNKLVRLVEIGDQDGAERHWHAHMWASRARMCSAVVSTCQESWTSTTRSDR
jgi:DNA-binding GntR family transcriptional regulator